MKDARHTWASELSRTAPSPHGSVRYVGPHPFGTESVHRYVFGNGLTLLVLSDTSAPVASYFTWFRVGSRHETPGKTGLAHLFEHLMFGETENLRAGQFDRKLEENGAESNAATWVDWTYYYESLPSDRLPLAVTLEAERMARLVLREPQVESEKEVVANERRYRVDDDIEGTMSELLYKTAFTRHAYHWPTIGWMKDIQGFTPEDCQGFYRTYYAPNNATIVVVGKVREKDILSRIQKAYGEISPADIPEENTQPDTPQGGERRLEITLPTATEKVAVAFHGPALGDRDHVLLSVLSEILVGGRASRLFRKLVVETELCGEVRGWVSTFRDPGLYEFFLTARPEKRIDDAISLLDEELAKVTQELVTPDELVCAKSRLELSMLQSLDTMSGKAEQIGFYETVLGDPGFAFRRLEQILRVTAGELRTVARRYLRRDERVVLLVRPGEKSLGEAS